MNEEKQISRTDGLTCCGTTSSDGGFDTYGCTALDMDGFDAYGCALLWHTPLLEATFSERAMGGGIGRLYGA